MSVLLTVPNFLFTRDFYDHRIKVGVVIKELTPFLFDSPTFKSILKSEHHILIIL